MAGPASIFIPGSTARQPNLDFMGDWGNAGSQLLNHH